MTSFGTSGRTTGGWRRGRCWRVVWRGERSGKGGEGVWVRGFVEGVANRVGHGGVYDHLV